MTLDVYAGLFADDLDAVADRMHAAKLAADADRIADQMRIGGVVRLPRAASDRSTCRLTCDFLVGRVGLEPTT